LNRGFGPGDLKKIPSSLCDSVPDRANIENAAVSRCYPIPQVHHASELLIPMLISSLGLQETEEFTYHFVTYLCTSLPGRTATVDSEMQCNSCSGTIDFAGAVP